MFKQLVWTLILLCSHVPNSQFFSSRCIISNLELKMYQELLQSEGKGWKVWTAHTHPFKLNRKTKGGGGPERAVRSQTHRKAVVDVLGAGFSHAGVSQVHLIKYDRLEKHRDCCQRGRRHPWPRTAHRSPSTPAKCVRTTWIPSDFTQPTSDSAQGSWEKLKTFSKSRELPSDLHQWSQNHVLPRVPLRAGSRVEVLCPFSFSFSTVCPWGERYWLK